MAASTGRLFGDQGRKGILKSVFGKDARLNRESTTSMSALTKEEQRLEEPQEQKVHSKRSGP